MKRKFKLICVSLLCYRIHVEPGQISKPTTKTVSSKKRSGPNSDKPSCFHIENVMSKPLAVFVQTPFAIKNYTLKSHSNWIK